MKKFAKNLDGIKSLEELKKKQDGEFLPKLDKILKESTEEMKQGMHPASINNQTSSDGTVLKSEVCFKRHAGSP